MRSRQHVVIARLNDEEYKIYQRILRQALLRNTSIPCRSKSDMFRATLMVMNEFLNNKAHAHATELLKSMEDMNVIPTQEREMKDLGKRML